MRVDVVHAQADSFACVSVELDEPATVADAIRAARLDVSFMAVAIFGRKADLSTPLNEGDRVELLRALRDDPLEARRRRARQKRNRA